METTRDFYQAAKRRVAVLEMVLLAATLPARRAPQAAPV